MISVSRASQEGLEEPVIGVIKIKVDSPDAAALVAEAVDVLVVEAKSLPGFMAAQVLLSVDKTTVVVLTEWRDHHAWAQSRYDRGVGKFVERALIASTTIEFELYTRAFGIASPLP